MARLRASQRSVVLSLASGEHSLSLTFDVADLLSRRIIRWKRRDVVITESSGRVRHFYELTRRGRHVARTLSPQEKT